MMFAILNTFAFVFYLLAAVCHGAVLTLKAQEAPLMDPKSHVGLIATRFGRPLLLTGLIVQFAAIGVWCVSTHRSPFASAYGTLAVLAWVIGLTYLLIDLHGKLPAVGAVALLISCVSIFLGSLNAHRALADAAFLNSQMVNLHVLTILASFALFAIAFGCAALYLLQNRLLKARNVHESLRRLPSLATLDTIAFQSVAFALPSLTVGLALGIAYLYSGTLDTPPGRWFADPHTLISLGVWSLYIVYMTARFALGWRGVRLQYILLAGLVLALAVYALPTTTHHFTH